MLVPGPKRTEASRNLRRERRLWIDQGHYTPSLGCTACPDQAVCGGLHVESRLYDCLALCCGTPGICDAVCRRNPEAFVKRVREVDGFLFDNVPRAPVLAAPSLPPVVPVVYHGSRRHGPFEGSTAVCLPLYTVIQRYGGKGRYASRFELANGFGISTDTPLILTGTAVDPPLERWWAMGTQRLEIIRTLRRLGVKLVTTPNYSLFVDQPRWDDLHNMKRIALVHAEFLSEGLPAALHVNARTERDWSRWRNYLAVRPEVTHIAFEFATGAGRAGRISWHADQLAGLAASARRPVHLVLRGGLGVVPQLAAEFSGVTILDTSVFMKTMRRKRAVVTSKSDLNWCSSPTEAGEPLDTLLADNWRTVSAFHTSLCHPTSRTLGAVA